MGVKLLLTLWYNPTDAHGKKKLTVIERLPLCRAFHRELAAIQRHGVQVDPIYGAFALDHMWNADHIPLPFAISRILPLTNVSFYINLCLV